VTARGARRRELLLRAALELFGALGYEGTHTRAIAERTGVTESALFRHFRSKRDLYAAVVERFAPHQVFDLSAAQRDDLPLQEALRLLVRDSLETCREHQMWFRVVLASRPVLGPGPAGAVQLRLRNLGEELLSMLHRRARAGELDAERAAPARQVAMYAFRHCFRRLVRNPPEQWRDRQERFAGNLSLIVAAGVRYSDG